MKLADKKIETQLLRKPGFFYYIKTLFLIIFLTSAFNAQENQNNIEQDSTSTSSETSFIPFNETESYYFYKYSVKHFTDFSTLPFDTDLNYSSNPYLFILSPDISKDFMQSKKDLQQILDNQYRLIQSQSLGTFGQILGAAAAATAAGLAVYHVIKYKEVYGIK